MGEIKVRYYSVRRRGGAMGYWQPTKSMRAAGFELVVCGEDGPEAWRIAEAWNQRWDAFRKGDEVRRWPLGSLGSAYNEFRLTNSWMQKTANPRRPGKGLELQPMGAPYRGICA
jgi:hypothetical protein